MKNAIIIRKEEVRKLIFTPEILSEKKRRQVNLNLSSAIDNFSKLNKAAIFFSTTRGLFQVTAKVLMKGDKFVVLKGNIMIPVNCIIKVGV